MRPEQSEECYEHHMLLKAELDKINHFLFGDIEHGSEVSFVSKTNLVFCELQFIKQCLLCSIVTLLSACVFLGKQLYKIDTNAQNLNAYIERSQQIELRLAKLEVKVEKKVE